MCIGEFAGVQDCEFVCACVSATVNVHLLAKTQAWNPRRPSVLSGAGEGEGRRGLEEVPSTDRKLRKGRERMCSLGPETFPAASAAWSPSLQDV